MRQRRQWATGFIRWDAKPVFSTALTWIPNVIPDDLYVLKSNFQSPSISLEDQIIAHLHSCVDFAPVTTFLLSMWTIRFTKEDTCFIVVLGAPSLIPSTDTVAAAWSFHKTLLETTGKCTGAQAQVREKIMMGWHLLLWRGWGRDL